YGAAFGTALHALFAWLLQHPDAPNDQIATMRSLLLARHVPHDERPRAQRQTARAMTRRFVESPLWEQVHAAEAVRVETPITYAEDDGTVVRGAIDLIYRTASSWHLVDFKTDRLRTEADVELLAAQYAPQVRAYAAQWERLTGAPVATAHLWLADVGQAVPVP
ncbi:MAG: hypothetical protein GVY27_09710, partial [Deinococcus-Thermus bacterium]|nr:hypothetical protein [Deinococcota bacterium]